MKFNEHIQPHAEHALHTLSTRVITDVLAAQVHARLAVEGKREHQRKKESVSVLGGSHDGG